jgi:hypothetical protein
MIGQNGKNSSNRLRPTQGYNAIRRRSISKNNIAINYNLIVRTNINLRMEECQQEGYPVPTDISFRNRGAVIIIRTYLKLNE